MKCLTYTLLLLVGFFLTAVAPVQAQSQDADVLRNRIELLEKTDVKSRSATVQDIYKRSLLRLYNQYLSAIKQDLADLKNIQSATNGTDSDTQKEVAAKIRNLTEEESITTEKLQTLTADARTSASSTGYSSQAPAAEPVATRPARLVQSSNSTSASGDGSANMNNQPTGNVRMAGLRTTAALPAQETAAAPAAAPTPEPPVIFASSLHEGSSMISGKLGGGGHDGSKVSITLNGEDMGKADTDGNNGFFTKTISHELKANDIVEAVQLGSDDVTPASLHAVQRIRAEKDDPYKGGPVGYLLGGMVFSQQGDQFNQADPFFGFTAGYSSYMHGKPKPFIDNGDGTFTTSDNQIVTKCKNNATNHWEWCFVETDPKTGISRFVMEDKKRKTLSESDIDTGPEYKRSRSWRWNIRFQGIFTAEPRKAEATQTATTDTTGGSGGSASGSATDSFKFIASRKSFDIEMHGWIDLFPTRTFSIGPYGAIGASTALQKNEVANEPTTVSDNNASGNTGAGSGTGTTTAAPTTVVTAAKSDNDIKKYLELGLLSNTHMFNRSLFLQTILAYGQYEALQGLGKENQGFLADSRNRFIGKLRIFPTGLRTTFGKQIEAAPMFGVEMNAGRGPDFVKFFVGYSIKIQKLSGVPGLQ